MLQVEELDQALLKNTKGFHFGSISLIAEPSRSATKAAIDMALDGRALISFDVNYRPSLWTTTEEATRQIEEMIPLTNLLKVNETELEILSGRDDLEEGSQELMELGPELVVITLGAAGSCFRSAGGFDCVPPFRVQTVDSVGCGDAFTAGLLSRLGCAEAWHQQLEPDLLRQHLRYANAVGALTARKKGVIPALPSAMEVEMFLQTTI